MPQTLTYPKIARSTVRRYNSRATYDLQKIHSIVDASAVLHVSFAPDPDDDFPAILPMIGKMGSFDFPSADLGEPLDCYLHGYVSSRIMNLARTHVENGAKGLPVCIAATQADGIVLSLTPNSHSYNYRSAVLHGHASLVTSDDEKRWAMRLVTDGVVPQRWDNTRVPPDKAEMESTRILRVQVASGSGKIRQGGPHDDKKDTDRDEVTSSTWTGVLPLWESVGEPISSASNRVDRVPEHIQEYVRSRNKGNRAAALDAVEEPKPAGNKVGQDN
ncbi:MAG: hypothetical protein M1832_006215 [Thelocarpon impressellum]|nr:MAG: hypothetical protein M1832_006215 [Thelocarpon impressellum]